MRRKTSKGSQLEHSAEPSSCIFNPRSLPSLDSAKSINLDGTPEYSSSLFTGGKWACFSQSVAANQRAAARQILIFCLDKAPNICKPFSTKSMAKGSVEELLRFRCLYHFLKTIFTFISAFGRLGPVLVWSKHVFFWGVSIKGLLSTVWLLPKLLVELTPSE